MVAAPEAAQGGSSPQGVAGTAAGAGAEAGAGASEAGSATAAPGEAPVFAPPSGPPPAACPPPLDGAAGEAPAGADAAAAATIPVAGAPAAAALVPEVQKPRIVVIGDENALFTCGIQEAYPDYEFTCSTVLTRQNLELYNFDPSPPQLRGRIRYMVDPCRVGKHFKQNEFEHIMLFLPGLSFAVPPELGSADRPLFAYRTHLFAFHVIRHAKLVLKPEAKLHLVWPEETGLMTSPCGAAGIEMPQLMQLCGCKPLEADFQFARMEDGWFMPFVFGEVPQERPEWLASLQIHSFTMDKSPIPIPLSVALLLHPDVGFVTIKDQTSDGPHPPPGVGTALRACLVHEASVRKDRLKEIFGPKESKDATVDAYGLVPEPVDEDSLLCIPMEIFMISFDELPHISMLLRYVVCEDQPQVSVSSLDILDPRLPTRIARPPPPKSSNPLVAAMNALVPGGRKRGRQAEEEWGGMKFFCPLTKICTMTPDRMRLHMSGDLYKRLAASTAGWEESQDKKDLIAAIEDAEALEEQQKKARKAMGNGPGGGKGKGKGK